MKRSATTSLPKLAGKTIANVIVAEGTSPVSQLFFVFTDGTYYEFFSESAIDGGTQIHSGDAEHVRALARGSQRLIFDTASPKKWRR